MSCNPKIICQIFICLIVGAVGCMCNGWGFFEPYLTSYLRIYDENVTTSILHYGFFMGYIGQLFGAFIFAWVVKIMGYRELLALIMLFCALTMIIGYECDLTTIYIFSFVNGIQETWRKTVLPFIMLQIAPNLSVGLAASLANAGTSLAGVWWSETAVF